MPRAPAGPCRQPGCPARAVRRGLCARHAQEAAADYRRTHTETRPNARARGYSSAWDKLRAAYINQHPDCEKCNAPGPAGMIVDHITPKAHGGLDKWDNCQTLCRKCHGEKTAADGLLNANAGAFGRRLDDVWAPRAEFRASRIPVTIVAGPPGSGKTTYVEQHKQWGDLVVDMDALYHALTGGLPWYDKPDVLLPFVCEARDAVLARLARASQVRRAWLVTGRANLVELQALKDQLKAERVVVLEVSAVECLRRIRNDPRRADRWLLWEELVRRWWSDYLTSKRLTERAPVIA